jgi:hypothetical protein
LGTAGKIASGFIYTIPYLVQQFAQLLRTRTGEQLDAWLEQVRASQISGLQRFVARSAP